MTNKPDYDKIKIITGHNRIERLEKMIRNSTAFKIFNPDNDVLSLLRTLSQDELTTIEGKLESGAISGLRKVLVLHGLIADPKAQLSVTKFLVNHYKAKRVTEERLDSAIEALEQQLKPDMFWAHKEYIGDRIYYLQEIRKQQYGCK